MKGSTKIRWNPNQMVRETCSDIRNNVENKKDTYMCHKSNDKFSSCVKNSQMFDR